MKSLKLSTLLFYVILVSALATTTSCTKKSASNSSDDLLALLTANRAEILLTSIATEKCLNVEKLTKELSDDKFSFPAAVMTTNYRSLNEMALTRSQYFAFSNFYYKTTKANKLDLFRDVHQDECKSITMKTASNEVLNFKITEATDHHIKFQLTDTYEAGLRDFQKKSLKERIQPYEYDLTYVSQNQIVLKTKYKTLDVLCPSKNQKTLNYEVTKTINWANTEDSLPQQYAVNPTFLDLAKAALSPTNPPAPLAAEPELPLEDPIIAPATDGDGSAEAKVVPVTEISTIMSSQIKNEVKVCTI